MPLLIGLKLKMAIISIISFLGIAFLAKKALLAAFISLAISGYIGIKKLLAPPPAPAKTISHEDLGYHAAPYWSQPSSSYSSGNWAAYDNHADYGSSAGAGQHLAYAGHKTS